MLFNSYHFLIFFPIVLFIYFLVPKKMRYIWLLLSSYYFYMNWNPRYAILIAISTIITYLSGIGIQFYNNNKNNEMKKCIVSLSIISNLSILIIFKYSNFILANLNIFLEKFEINCLPNKVDLLLPVGISFYTFQALSYTIDVYRGNIKAEQNILRYSLFVSFFPQLVAGPIERSTNLISQIQNIDRIELLQYERIKSGTLLMAWGFFQKLIISDRIAIFVNQIFDFYYNYGAIEIGLAAVLFAFQIYFDFNGYTFIARGTSRIIGIELIKNFKQPYLASGIQDFWRRWHISLTTWFTDYLYIPLGGNKKGLFRKYVNIIIVFLISGLWHGASWNFIFWGLLHAIYQIVENITEQFVKMKNSTFTSKLTKSIGTFLLIDFAWIFFRAPSFSTAINIIRQMLVKKKCTSLFDAISKADWIVLIFALGIVFVVEIFLEKGYDVLGLLNKQKLYIRLLLYFAIFWTIVLFGVYGAGYSTNQFIYFQF